MRKVKVAPSIFAANFLNIEREVKKLEKLKVDYIHYDIMDYHFVQNISFGPLVTEQIAKNTFIPGDVHLMIELSKEKIKPFIIDNVEIITLHVEAPGFSKELLEFIKNKGKKAGISIKPQTTPRAIEPFLELLDLVLVMTVEPGFSGQNIIPEAIAKVSEVKKLIESTKRNIHIEVDGGVNLENIPILVEQGANLLVIGSFFFRNGNGKKIMRFLEKFC